MAYVISGGVAVRVQPNTIAHLREAISDVSRTIEDLTWTNVSQDSRTIGVEERWQARLDLIARLRVYRRRSPLAKAAFALCKNYVLGQGVTIRPNNKVQVAKVIDEFWDDPVNQATFCSHEAMTQALDTLYTDGDLFLVLFPDRELGKVQLSWVDSADVQDIVNDPDNWRLPLWYKVKKRNGAFNFRDGAYETNTDEAFVYYRDYRNDPESDDYIAREGLSEPSSSMIAPGMIFHIAINKRGKFGESELAAAADWLKAHKEFMEDRATLSKAAAQIAWRKKRRGSANDIQGQVDRLQSSLVQNLQRWETNPTGPSGQTLVENEGSTMEWVKTDTGSGNAQIDERILRMMVGASVGVMNHYFGDEGASNLATATAMELPMLKMYEGWQKLLADVIRRILQYVLEVANAGGRIGDEDLVTKYSPPTRSTDLLKQIASSPSMQSVKEALDEASHEYLSIVVREGGPMAVVTNVQPKSVDQNENDNTGAVDWYIDVDFPPIVQREIGGYIAALKNLFSMMPILNIESQKLVVSMALTALGSNDVDEVMAKLFAGDFANAAFAVIPIQQTGISAPGSLAPVGQAGMPGAAPGVPKVPGTTDLPVGKQQPPTDRPQNER